MPLPTRHLGGTISETERLQIPDEIKGNRETFGKNAEETNTQKTWSSTN